MLAYLRANLRLPGLAAKRSLSQQPGRCLVAAEGDLLQGSVLLQGRLAVSLHVVGSSERRRLLDASVGAFPWRASPARDASDSVL